MGADEGAVRVGDPWQFKGTLEKIGFGIVTAGGFLKNIKFRSFRCEREACCGQYLEHRILSMLIEQSRALSQQVVAVCHLDDGDEGTPEVAK